jgi:hypothetical protein
MFLNVDTDLVSQASMDSLRSELSTRAVVLRDTNEQGTHTLTFELGEEWATPEECIMHVNALYESLSLSSRSEWRRCVTRTLDIGVAHQEGRHAFAFALSEECLAWVAAMGCSLRTTLYGAPDTTPA